MPMVTQTDFLACIESYKEDFRKEGLPALRESALYDLFPKNQELENCWPNKWPHNGEAGVYAIFDEDLNLLYVGKSSMNNSIGSRLSSYFGFETDKSCLIKQPTGWSQSPRFVQAIAVPEGMRYEAPALEEYLIMKLTPPDNTKGK